MERKVKLCVEVDADGDSHVQIEGTKSEVLCAMSTLAYCLHTRANMPEADIRAAVADGLCGLTKKLIDEAADITELNLSHPIRKDEGK